MPIGIFNPFKINIYWDGVYLLSTSNKYYASKFQLDLKAYLYATLDQSHELTDKFMARFYSEWLAELFNANIEYTNLDNLLKDLKNFCGIDHYPHIVRGDRDFARLELMNS